MSEHPLFSVLIANYNNGKYLQEAIDSVLAQTYTHWEIIIVDDKSTDNSYDIYHKYENDPRFHIYYNEENKGCGYAKRRCAEMANGELCGFLDADDALTPQALQLMVNTHQEHDDCSLVMSRFYVCDEKMNILFTSRLLVVPNNETYLTYKNFQPEVFASYKKNMYDKTEGLNAYILKGIDQDLYFKLEEIAPIYVLNEFTYKVRQNKNSISRYDKGYSASLWNYAVRYEACKRRNISYEDICLDSFMSLYSRYDAVLNSHAFRLGSFLLQPIYLLKKIFSKSIKREK